MGGFRYCMNRKITLRTAVVALFLACSFLTTACASQRPSQAPVLDGGCGAFFTVGPDGQLLLTRSQVTLNNTEQINSCLRRAGIDNVKVARSLDPTQS